MLSTSEGFIEKFPSSEGVSGSGSGSHCFTNLCLECHEGCGGNRVAFGIGGGLIVQ